MSFKEHGIGNGCTSYTKNGKKVFDAEYVPIRELCKERQLITIIDFETECPGSNGKNDSCWILFEFDGEPNTKYKTCTTSSRIIRKLQKGAEMKIFPETTFVFPVKSKGHSTYDID